MGPEVLERDDALSIATSSLDRLSDGVGSGLLIVGAAGIGKTTVLASIRRRARDADALVLNARASELDRGFAFGIVHQLFEPTVFGADADERGRLFAGAARHAEVIFDTERENAESEYTVFRGLYWLLVNLAEERPVVLMVDDLHWADPESLRWLEFMTRRTDDLPVLLVMTTRLREPGAPDELLAEIRAETSEIPLAELSAASVGRIFASALGEMPSDAFRDAAREITGGNPLLVDRLAREAAREGLRGRETDISRLSDVGSRGLATTVIRRLSALDARAIAVARAAAILGERAPLGDLAELVGEDFDVVYAALSDLEHAGILVPGGWAYAHPLLGDAVRAALAPSERERLHRQAAVIMRRRGAPPAEIALHWLATSPMGDPDTVADLRAAAAVSVAQGAAGTAVALLRRALIERTTLDDPLLAVDLAELELRMLLPEGRERARWALEQDLPSTAAVRLRAALSSVLVLSDPDAALQEINVARNSTGDERLRLQLEAAAFETLVMVDALAESRREWFASARRSASPSVVELAFLTIEESMVGRPAPEVIEYGVGALKDDVLVAEVGPGRPTWNLLSHGFRFAEAPVLSDRVLAIGSQAVREHGLRTAGVFIDQAWGYWHRDFGSAARGLAHAQSALDAIEDADLPVSRVAIGAAVAENLVLLDRIDEADQLMDTPFGMAEQTFVAVFALSARGLTRRLAGRLLEAERDLRRVIEILNERGWRAPWTALGRLRLAELLIERERMGEARELVQQDEIVAREAGTRGALGAVLRVRAATETGVWRHQTLIDAERELAASPLRYEHGRALLDLGISHRERGDRSAARDVLRASLDCADRTESTRLSRRVYEELRAAGARPRRTRTSGVEALTARERRIAELAAEGLTNREIAEALWVTHKTVEYHLGKVYAKLKVPSRHALATALDVNDAGYDPHP